VHQVEQAATKRQKGQQQRKNKQSLVEAKFVWSRHG
jgi:hypothetical protein